MTKEKLVSLKKYLQDLNSRLTGDLPVKHKNRQKSFHTFLKTEIKKVEAKIKDAELQGVK